MGEVVCPFCSQDVLLRKRFRPTGELIQVCPECDMLWADGVDVDRIQGTPFGSWADARAQLDDWTLLEDDQPERS